MKQRVGFARALAVEPEILFMDEPFSALDVLTAENLRGELMELWLGKKIPTRSIFLVTHNIEEAVLLADRVMVLGRNPARIRADFQIPLPQPRERTAAEFLVYVDYIYKLMTQPRSWSRRPPGRPPKPAYPMLPHARPGGIAGLLELLHRPRRQRGSLPHRRRSAHGSGRPAAHRGSQHAAGLRRCRQRRCGDSRRRAKQFAEADIARAQAAVPRSGAGARQPAAADEERAGEQDGPHHAARSSSATCWTSISPTPKSTGKSIPR